MEEKDLKIGMLTTAGLITRVVLTSDDFFWKKEHFYYFDINDGYNGQCGRAIDWHSEITILHERGTDEYNKIVDKLIHERVSAMMDCEKDIDLLRAYK